MTGAGDRAGWSAFDSLISLAARNTARPEWVRVFARVSAEATETDHPARDRVLRHNSSTRRWLTDAIGSGISGGSIRADIPVTTVVNNTIAILDRVQEQWVVDPSAVSMVESVSEHVRQLKEVWTRKEADFSKPQDAHRRSLRKQTSDSDRASATAVM